MEDAEYVVIAFGGRTAYEAVVAQEDLRSA